jgi:hypothetical protein
MSLLTTEAYKAIATGLSFPTTAFIDGHFRPAISGKTFDTINPATRQVLAQVAASGPDEVDLAAQTARDAFEDGRWSRRHPRDRKEAVIRFAQLVKRNAREPAEDTPITTFRMAELAIQAGIAPVSSTSSPAPAPMWANPSGGTWTSTPSRLPAARKPAAASCAMRRIRTRKRLR